jgi:hypothetical protein
MAARGAGLGGRQVLAGILSSLLSHASASALWGYLQPRVALYHATL